SRVRPDQRKTVLVLLDVLDGNLPAFHRVAGFAIRPHLATMDIGVAGSAGVADAGEKRLWKGLSGGGQRRAQAARPGGRLVGSEIRQRTNWLPTHAGVTCLAGNAEIAMRTSGGGLIRRLARQQKRRRNHEEQDGNGTFQTWPGKTRNSTSICRQISCSDT